ncbi:hypothetical protein [Streptomyces millisiae]|uniref:Uncharacterized protein n=1 Tax=Streptomyces millisiae TaxID=3075542 RepID=A0ABU2M174_9ACTN|nr:hypothetical protein [Streptomyces sp. DSM 44918]MDT0323142.1 hypothetical protein [Streptomyces sp. DSM 44918]
MPLVGRAPVPRFGLRQGDTVRLGSAVIFTSDPDDIHAYPEVLAPPDVHVVAV